MSFKQLPPYAAWRHVEAQDGFEVVFMSVEGDGLRFEGQTVAIEAGEPWWVEYELDLTPEWLTRRAWVKCRSSRGRSEVRLETDGKGNWQINGEPAPHLEGIFDVDLESSALTNAFPVHRLGLQVGDESEAPAAYVRELDASAERLEQYYQRIPHTGPGERYAYESPAFDTKCELVYDEFGLVIDYPGIAVRTQI